MESARDKAIEELITARLRVGLKSGAPDCPAAEVPAAFVEGTLAPRERASFEAHLAGCARCQESLAGLVRLREADEGAASPALRPRPAKPFVFRWAWVGTTLAAILVAGIWFNHEYQTGLRQQELSSQQLPAVAPQPPTTAAAPPSKETQGESTQGVAAEKSHRANQSQGGTESMAGRSPGDAIRAEARPALKSGARPRSAAAPEIAKQMPVPAAPPTTTAESATYGTQGARSEAANNLQLSQGSAGGTSASALAEKAANAPAPAPLAPRPNAGLAARSLREPMRAEAPAANAGSEIQDKSVVHRKAEAKKALTSLPAATQSVEVKATEAQTVQAEPQAALVPPRWRVGQHGLILEADSNGNWKKHDSGVASDLFDVSFCSPNIGWIVGERGIILRTTDGGNTWTRMPSPSDQDLTQVISKTAFSASVTGRNGVKYTTTDGGKTWTTGSE